MDFFSSYQVHWTDVCYMERVERSLTSLQVSIHSVVADSNRQARKLHDDITELRDMMEVSVRVERRWRCMCVRVERRWRCVCVRVERRWRCVCVRVERRWRCVCVRGYYKLPCPLSLQSGDPAPILAGLPAVVTLCTQRTAYLHCRATLRQGGRVGGERKREREGEGRQQGQPISAVNISCSIRE